jgi:chemotaxis protein methyltransferase CheR
MTTKISDAVLSQLSEFVASRFGLYFPRERWLDLQRAVCCAAQECGCRDDMERYIQGLLVRTLSQGQIEALASHLTVGETYFFRENCSLEILDKHIVPGLIRARKGLGKAIKIWSAGCSTGEEPYSVAIVLSKLMAGPEKWNVEILATDLNARSLQKASEGIYGEWSFRGTPAWVRRTYCEAVEDDRWAIVPTIKKMVSFAQLNLIDDAYAPFTNYPNSQDVIFCRNVLMYFTPEGMRKVVRQLHRSLATDGWLIVSPTETSQELFSEFATITLGDVTLYRKSATHPSTTLALPLLDEDRSGVQLPEWTMQAPELVRIAHGEPNQEAPEDQTCLESVASSKASYEQALRLYEQGRYEDMEQVIVALPPQDGDHASTTLLLARSYANQGKLAAALVWCDKAIAADKMAARAYYLRATILQEQGSIPEALLALKHAVYAEPQFVLGHFSLGNLALKDGRLKESEKHFENVFLLLAQYQPEDIVPESEGLSAGKLREMIVSQRGGMAPITPRSELSHRMFPRAGKPRIEQAETR